MRIGMPASSRHRKVRDRFCVKQGSTRSPANNVNINAQVGRNATSSESKQRTCCLCHLLSRTPCSRTISNQYRQATVQRSQGVCRNNLIRRYVGYSTRASESTSRACQDSTRPRAVAIHNHACTAPRRRVADQSAARNGASAKRTGAGNVVGAQKMRVGRASETMTALHGETRGCAQNAPRRVTALRLLQTCEGGAARDDDGAQGREQATDSGALRRKEHPSSRAARDTRDGPPGKSSRATSWRRLRPCGSSPSRTNPRNRRRGVQRRGLVLELIQGNEASSRAPGTACMSTTAADRLSSSGRLLSFVQLKYMHSSLWQVQRILSWLSS